VDGVDDESDGLEGQTDLRWGVNVNVDVNVNVKATVWKARQT